MLKRIEWIDVCKFIGIFIIYFWHLGEGIGRSYQFILIYHVPLFFFLSGCTESLQSEISFSDYVKKKAKTILLPFFVFALLSMLLVICYERCGGALILLMVKQILMGGMRNRIFAYSLWFLTCLFVMSLLFFFLKKGKRRSLIFLTGAVLYVITARVLPYKPNLFPMLPYNADCALYYMIFYCTGYCLFPKMQELLQEEGKSRNIVLAAVGILGGVYAVCLFFGKDGLAALLRLPVIRIFHPYLSAMILILWNTALAFFLQKSGLLQKLGRESLYLCGNEFIVKTVAAAGASCLGIAVPPDRPVFCAVYAAVLLLAAHFVLIPLEKRIAGLLRFFLNIF